MGLVSLKHLMKNKNLFASVYFGIFVALFCNNLYSQKDNIDKSFLGINSDSAISKYEIENTNKIYPLDFILDFLKDGKFDSNSILTLKDIDDKSVNFRSQGEKYNSDIEKGIPNDFNVKMAIIKECKSVFHSKKVVFNESGDLSVIDLIGQASPDKSESIIAVIKNSFESFYGDKYKTIEDEKTQSIFMFWEGQKFNLLIEFSLFKKDALQIHITYERK